MSARLSILRGLPGSGKSTFASRIGCEYVEADMMMLRDAEGTYKFDPERLGAAHRWCQDTVRCWLYSGRRVAVANTNTRLSEMRPYLQLAAELGAVDIYEFQGRYGSVHGVDEETMARMHLRWQPRQTIVTALETDYPALRWTYNVIGSNKRAVDDFSSTH